MGGNYSRWLYALVVLLTVIAGLYLSGWIYGVLRACGDILALYFTAWLLQFFFTPVVDLLARYRIPRALAVCYVYLVLALAIVIAAIPLSIAIYNQGTELARALGTGQTYEVITNAARGIDKFLVQHGVPEKDIQHFTEEYSVNLRNGAVSAGQSLQRILQQHLNASAIGTSVNTFLSFVSTLQTLLIDVIIVLILAFYMTLDGHRITRHVLGYFPPAASDLMADVHGIVNRKFGGYLRGQIILAATYAVLTLAIAYGFRLPSPIFIAIFAGVMMLIPFIGTLAAIIPPIVFFVIANVDNFPTLRFVLLIGLLLASQQLVINLLSPRVMSSAVGMHPLLVILGLLLGIKVAGLWGAIFGVPVFGVAVETADLLYRRFMARRYDFHPIPAPTGAVGEESSPTPAATSEVSSQTPVASSQRDVPRKVVG